MANELKYSPNGLWVAKNGENYRVGLSEKGQDDIGEIMFADIPKDIAVLKAGDSLLGVEGAKAVTELESPLSGDVVQFNESLLISPEELNSEDQKSNWIVELTNVDASEFAKLEDSVQL
ncbi:glycine cleavage system protein H [Desemzia sp. RIT804]|uniref:glycine cleavage system protein H n=1 Tax=Desemzia sp. RIT 804 TaxID=2810209 RepID=UPI00194F8358|nr:glycine cleavage system protein H [Desemzia sp. RIT 804]MBM6615733.1 glycine cleavage system protein H [Desemzia sp. RIT 804]